MNGMSRPCIRLQATLELPELAGERAAFGRRGAGPAHMRSERVADLAMQAGGLAQERRQLRSAHPLRGVAIELLGVPTGGDQLVQRACGLVGSHDLAPIC